jgi:hypothetical protein
MSLLLPKSLTVSQPLTTLFYTLRLNSGAITQLIGCRGVIAIEFRDHWWVKLMLLFGENSSMIFYRKPWRNHFHPKTLIVLEDSVCEAFLTGLNFNKLIFLIWSVIHKCGIYQIPSSTRYRWSSHSSNAKLQRCGRLILHLLLSLLILRRIDI